MQPPFGQTNAPVAVIGGAVVPLHTPSQISPMLGSPQQQTSQFRQNQHPGQMFNSNSLQQKGAFIPLQVARGINPKSTIAVTNQPINISSNVGSVISDTTEAVMQNVSYFNRN